MFHKHRKTGAAMTTGTTTTTTEPAVPAAPVAGPGYQGTNEQPMMMTNQQQPMVANGQYQQQQQYNSHPQFVSPVASPAPNYEQQNKYMETATQPQHQQHNYGQPVQGEMYPQSMSPPPQVYQQTHPTTHQMP